MLKLWILKYYKRLISETIYIKTQDNDLNLMEDTDCLDSSYFNLLTKISDINNNMLTDGRIQDLLRFV